MTIQPLETRVARHSEQIDGLKIDLAEIKSDVKDMRSVLVGRPSWTVAGALAFLSSTTVGLAVALLSLPHH